MSSAPIGYRLEDHLNDSATDGPQRAETEEYSGRKRRLEYPEAPQPLGVPTVDNHAHLDFRDGHISVSVTQAMDAAATVNVTGAVHVGCDLESARFTIEAIETEPRLLGAVAIHPNTAAELDAESRETLDAHISEINEMAAHPRVRAVGETGLDYFRTGPEGVEAQKYSFREHIRMAVAHGKALQIHDRDAHDDVVDILTTESELPPYVVFHCFSGDTRLAEICNEHGWYMSFAGPVTFKNNESLRQAAAIAREELLLVETDSPFLTPHPMRGRPNAPYMVPHTLRKLAEVRELAPDELGQKILENTTEVYGEF